MTFTLNRAEAETSNRAEEDDTERRYGFLSVETGAKYPPNLMIMDGTKGRDISWSTYLDTEIDTAGKLVMTFVSVIVTITGKGLIRPPEKKKAEDTTPEPPYLLESIHRRKLSYLEKSSETGPHIPRYVDNISITPNI